MQEAMLQQAQGFACCAAVEGIDGREQRTSEVTDSTDGADGATMIRCSSPGCQGTPLSVLKSSVGARSPKALQNP